MAGQLLMDRHTQYFHNFKEASNFAKDLSKDSGKSIKVNRHGRGFSIHIPEHLLARTEELVTKAAEKLISHRVNVGAFSAGILMLLDQNGTRVLVPDDSLVIEAFRRSDSSLTTASVNDIAEYLTGYGPEQQAGIINNVKGIYHELAFVNAENADLDAWTAEIMPVTNYPGADVVMSNSITGEVVELQLKATDSLSYVTAAAERYPDVSIAATSEVAAGNTAIADSGFSNEMITADVSNTAAAMQSAGEEAIFGEVLGDVLTGGAITGVLGAANALGGKGKSDDIAGDVAKAALRGLLFAFGLSFF